MGHIFISYSRKDEEYVNKLVAAIENEGFDVWIDRELLTGDKWIKTINHQIDTCDAFVIVMTDDSSRSQWVQREVLYAIQEGKRIFPLLLQGKLWMLLQDFNYFQVTDASIPSKKFFKDIEKIVPRSEVWLATQRETIEKARQKLAEEERQRIAKEKAARDAAREKVAKEALARQTARREFFAKFFERTKQYLRLVSIVIVIGLLIWGGAEVISKAFSGTTFTPSLSITSTASLLATASETPLPNEIKDSNKISMMLVPAGEFEMGKDDGLSDEKPSHLVYLDSFYIDKYEVTNSLYEICVKKGGCTRPKYTDLYYASAFENRPVVYVNWFMANAYCQWRGGSLPTEAQWEKAARGEEKLTYPWGELPPIVQYANYNGDASKDVGSFSSVRSPYGVLDLAGNVSEWVYDWYSPEYYQTVFLEKISNPTGPTDAPYQPSHNYYGRVFRGGSWRTTNTYELSTSFRYRLDPNSYVDDLGFRCAMDAP